MKLGIMVVCAAALGACAAGLSKEDAKTRDDYVLDEQVCIAKATSKAEGYDCICRVKAAAGRPCVSPLKDGGS